MAATMFPSDIRHEEVSPDSPPTTDKRKRFDSPPTTDKLDSGLGSSSSGSDRSSIDLSKFGSINDVTEFGPIKSSNEVSDIHDERKEPEPSVGSEPSPTAPPTGKPKLSEDGKKDDAKKHHFETDYPKYEYRPYKYESKIDHPIDWETWRKYKQQIEDSEAFEIDDYPGDCPGTYYRPLFDFKKSVATYSLLKDLGKMAVDHFNENNKKGFTFLDIERAVALPSGGVWFKLTITARDPDDGNAVKVLRAEIFHGVFEDEVESCKLKD